MTLLINLFHRRTSFSFECSFHACFYHMSITLFFCVSIHNRWWWLVPFGHLFVFPHLLCNSWIHVFSCFRKWKLFMFINNDWWSPSGSTKTLQIIRSVTLWHCGFLSRLVWCSFKLFQIFYNILDWFITLGHIRFFSGLVWHLLLCSDAIVCFKIFQNTERIFQNISKDGTKPLHILSQTALHLTLWEAQR